MSRPLRVVRAIARLNMGGPAHHVSILSERLPADRYRTVLVCGNVGAGEEELPVSVAPVRIATLAPELSPRRDLAALVQLVRLMRRERPDIVHTHTAKAGFLGRLAARLALGPRPIVVHTYHGHVLEGYFGRAQTALYRGLERTLGMVSDALIGVSQATVDDLVRLGVAPRHKFRVIPLGLDLDRLAHLGDEVRRRGRAELDLGADDIAAVFMGRLVAIKRVDRLVDALAAVRALGVPLVLVIVGGGELERALRAQARALGVEEAIRFAGYRADVAPMLAAADLAVLSSANEGTPVALIESAAAGLPLVATDVGGVAEVVGKSTGSLVGQDDAQGLIDAIAALARDDALRARYGAAAQSHVLGRYAATRLVHDVDALYLDIRRTRMRRAGSTETEH
jgi:glycosyltransferase involved in cell wall biosynthesis